MIAAGAARDKNFTSGIPAGPPSAAPSVNQNQDSADPSSQAARASIDLDLVRRANALDDAMKGGLFGAGTDEDAVMHALSGLTPERAKALEAEYKNHFNRDLKTDLQDELSGDDLTQAEKLLMGTASGSAVKTQPPASPATPLGPTKDPNDELAKRFQHSIEGLGTGGDIDSLLEQLGNKPADEAKKVQEAYQKNTGRSLEDDLKGDLSGRKAADAVLMLNGLPRDPAERQVALAQRNLAMYSREREGWGVGKMVVDIFNDQGERLDANAAKLKAELDQIPPGTKPTPDQFVALSVLNQRVAGDIKSYRGAKDSAADGAATVGATVGAGAAIFATAGMATPVVVAAATAAGGAGYVAGKAGVEGSDYEVDGMATDAIVGGVDGAMNVVGAGVAGKVAGKLGSGIVGKAATVVAEGAIEGGTGGAAGGATRTALQKDTWEDGVGAGLAKVGQSAVEQGVVGAVTGAGMKVATTTAGAALGAAARQAEKVEAPTITKPAAEIPEPSSAAPAGETSGPSSANNGAATNSVPAVQAGAEIRNEGAGIIYRVQAPPREPLRGRPQARITAEGISAPRKALHVGDERFVLYYSSKKPDTEVVGIKLPRAVYEKLMDESRWQAQEGLRINQADPGRPVRVDPTSPGVALQLSPSLIDEINELIRSGAAEVITSAGEWP